MPIVEGERRGRMHGVLIVEAEKRGGLHSVLMVEGERRGGLRKDRKVMRKRGECREEC